MHLLADAVVSSGVVIWELLNVDCSTNTHKVGAMHLVCSCPVYCMLIRQETAKSQYIALEQLRAQSECCQPANNAVRNSQLLLLLLLLQQLQRKAKRLTICHEHAAAGKVEALCHVLQWLQ